LDGKFQTYDVAPGTAETLYVLVKAGKIVFGPDIAPGFDGIVFIVIGKESSALDPQAFNDLTEILPPFASGITLMELVLDEPVHPLGIVHW
jgi:hypothetical protein